MQYYSYAFAAKPDKPTITKKNGGIIPYNERLSDGDIETIKALYKTLPVKNWKGVYHTWVRWGGERGRWEGYHKLEITDDGHDGRVLLGHAGEVQLYGSLFELNNIFTFPPSREFNPEFSGQILIRDGDQDPYYWGDEIVKGKCFKGTILPPGGGGPVDFRGRVTITS